MDFDDVAFGVVEEHLMPFFGKGSSIIRIGNAVVVQQLHEGRNIIGSKSDVAAFDRVYRFAMLKGDAEVFLGQVHLHLPIGRKADLAAIAPILRILGSWEILDRDVIQPKNARVKIVEAIHILRDKVDMVEFQFHIRVFPSAEHRFFQIADDQNPMSSTITNLTEIPEERT